MKGLFIDIQRDINERLSISFDFIMGYLFHSRMDISLGIGYYSFIREWIVHWRVDIILSLGDGYFIGGWILFFHWRMGISLGDISL